MLYIYIVGMYIQSGAFESKYLRIVSFDGHWWNRSRIAASDYTVYTPAGGSQADQTPREEVIRF